MSFEDPEEQEQPVDETSSDARLRSKVERKLERKALEKLGDAFIDEFGSEVHLCDSDCSKCVSK